MIIQHSFFIRYAVKFVSHQENVISLIVHLNIVFIYLFVAS